MLRFNRKGVHEIVLPILICSQILPHYFSYLHIHSQLDTHPFLPYNNLIKKNLDNFSIFLNIKKGKYYYTWLFAPRTSQISHNHFLKRKRSRNGGFYGKTLCKPG